MLNFEEIFNEYSQRFPAKKSELHKASQVRDKFSEIAEAVGIDRSLLKQYWDSTTQKMIQPNGPNAPYHIPEIDKEFVITLLTSYTSRDFKQLRRANYSDVPLETRLNLINGFCQLLIHLGHSPSVVADQRCRMERRLYFKIDEAVNHFNEQLQSFQAHIHGLTETTWFDLLHEDVAVLVLEAANIVRKAQSDFEALECYYRDIRGNELSDLAQEEAQAMGPEDDARIYDEITVSSALAKDPEFLRLIEKKIALFQEDAFVKQQMAAWKSVNEELQNVRARVAMEVLGHPLSLRTQRKDIRKHPRLVLLKAKEDLEAISKPPVQVKAPSEEEKSRCLEIIRASGYGDNPFLTKEG